MRKNIFIKYKKGYAGTIYLFFFTAASLSLITGIVGPAGVMSRVSTQTVNSKESYYASESGIEDVVYRLKNGMDTSSTETLTVGSSSATTTVTDLTGSTKRVSSVGDKNNLNRKIEVDVETSDGVAFNYGIQVGQGGFVLSNNSGVVGNVYSNGNITGSSGAYITGSAYAANSPSLSADQSNNSPSTPTNNITFSDSSSNQDIAQSFTVSAEAPLNKIDLYIKKVGSPSNITLRVTTDNSSKPSTTTLSSATLSASLVTTSYGWVSTTFSSGVLLTPGTTYWIVLDASTGNSTKNYVIGGNNTYAGGSGKIGQYSGTWNNTSPSGLDLYFVLYTGGTNSSISNVTVGASGGDVNAYTATGVTANGNLYCKSGSGNNKSCNTSQALPSSTGFPISDGQITEWKNAASDGGTYNGNYTINSTSASLGPIKINGNLTVTNNGVLTVTGTIWVTGTISFSNNATVKLSSGYGSSSGMIISDGAQTLSNNVVFQGSGTSGSYIMTLSTSSSSSAISISNNARAVIAYAPNGTIAFSNNAGAKEAVAKTISLGNNAVITYDSGLASVDFISGPSGSWAISSWNEVE